MRTVLNTMTGQVTFQPDNIIDHVTLSKYLLEVPEGTKPLVPGMFKPGTAEEFAELNAPAKDEAKPSKAPTKNEDQ